MEVKKIISNQQRKLSKIIEQNLSFGYSKIQKLIRSKNIKVNGKRVSKDENLFEGDVVEIYYQTTIPNIIYEDKDIIVVFKPRQIETVSDVKDDYLKVLEKYKNEKLFAVHRLDRNTEGLVIFAKNISAKQSLDEAFKNRAIHKHYLAWVVGVPKKQKDNLIAYLKKDEKKSFVYVSDKQQSGYDEIKTNYQVIKTNEETSILDVELLTGKTHQIRAHLAHIGHAIIGDEKYGLMDINKKYKKRFQCLCAYKIIFEFSDKNYLSHLNSKIVEIDKNNIDFFKNIT